VRNVAAYVTRAIDARTGLVTNLPGGSDQYLYGIVDWPPNMRYGYDMTTVARTTENVLAYDLFRRTSQIAGALGRPRAEFSVYQQRAATIAHALRQRVERANGVFVDGLEADGRPSAHASQQANAYALAFGVVPRARVAAVARYVVQLGNATGVDIFWVLLEGLHAAGRDDALRAAITDPSRPGYAQILREGATFTWESWDARQTGDSESHGWGAAVIPVLVEDFLGVTVTGPGASTVDVHVPALRRFAAQGVVATQRGPVAVTWRTATADAGVTLDVMIPANVVATVQLPASAVAFVRESGRALAGDPGVRSARASNGEVVVVLGSGRYSFVTGR
jgi:alpha-L-rhamnosidase